MTTPRVDSEEVAAAREERVAAPARDLMRVTETRPDGRRLTRYRRDP